MTWMDRIYAHNSLQNALENIPLACVTNGMGQSPPITATSSYFLHFLVCV